ncbi:hypothetical protein JCM1840_004229 [Sporobolomyces johnsonii]
MATPAAAPPAVQRAPSPRSPPRSFSPASSEGGGGAGWPNGVWGSSVLIPNEGSTARERTFLSWIKLTVILLAISSALLIRFQFGQGIQLPQYELDAQVPLGVLFFACAVASLAVGTSGFYSLSAAFFRRKGFAYAGKVADAIVLGIGLVIIAACILLLVAD